MPVVLRRAHPRGADVLSKLALRAKGYRGYDAEFLEACRHELTLTSEEIRYPGFHATVAEGGDAVAGYYALRTTGPDCCELEALFVDPPWIGTGIGRRLLDHARDLARALGAERMNVQSDPGAVRFYTRAGARVIGFEPSGSIPGRDLPVLEFVLQDSS